MYLMYVDESGDVGMVNSPTRYFALCGLVLHELRWRNYLDELLAFRRDIKSAFGLKLREEIHASAMLGRPGELKRIPKHHRLEILRRMADKLAALPEFSLVSVLVDKAGKPSDYDVFEKAWQALIQRFENTISHRNFPGPHNPDERGMLFPDHTDDKKLVRLLRRMRAYNPVPNQTVFGPGYRNLSLQYVIEDASLRDSRQSFFIQAADVCAFLLYQSAMPSGFMKGKSGQHYFKRLEPICCKKASNTDPQGLGIVRL